MAIFFDRQHEANPLNGSDIKEAAPLLQAIEELRTQEPSFFELESEKGTRLLVGVAPDKGCVQFSATDAGPYHMAMPRSTNGANEHVDFLMNNTATPIPHRYLLTLDETKEHAIEFLRSGMAAKGCAWEEI